MTFCNNCGTQIREGKKFCRGCGAPAGNRGGTPATAPPQPVYAQPPPPPPLQYAQQAAQQPHSLQTQPVYQQQYTQHGAPNMSEKQTVLANAPHALNRADRPWVVTVEGDSIVARWKWMDATFFAPHEVNDETRQFTFIVTLTDNRTWKELDKTQNKKSGVKMSGGKLSFGSSSHSFSGKSNQKSFTFGAGKNSQTGETGFIAIKFNTTDVKKPVRDYLTACGWKPAGVFG